MSVKSREEDGRNGTQHYCHAGVDDEGDHDANNVVSAMVRNVSIREIVAWTSTTHFLKPVLSLRRKYAMNRVTHRSVARPTDKALVATFR